ncbi:MAG: ester cyclase [Pseudomonadota bacterium]
MTDTRAIYHDIFAAFMTAPDAELEVLVQTRIAPNAVFDVSDPIGTLTGPDAILNGLLRPLRAALKHPQRRDLMLIGGENIREDGGDWLASVAHITGLFHAPLFGVAPNGRMVFLRFGEFYRVENGQLTQARIIVDLLHLLHEIDRYPLPGHYGTPVSFPAPATQDGICPANRADGARSLDIVQNMLGALHVYDPDTFGSDYQTGSQGLWHRDFMWYGPGGIGSTTGWTGFVDHHRADFLRAFPDRKGGNHYCRIGDGNYAAVSGWPSMTMTHQGPYLGVPATGKPLTLRVMDFYRCTETQIAENWVLLDYVHLLRQMGVDVLALAGEMTS